MYNADYIDSQMLHSGGNHLSICTGKDYISYCIYNSEQKQIVGFKHTSFPTVANNDEWSKKLEAYFEQDAVLHGNFSGIDFICSTRTSTIIPEAFFDTNHLKKHLDLVNPIDELDEIHFNKIDVLQAYVVFAVPCYVAASVLKRFPNAQFMHQTYPLIRNAHEENMKQGNVSVHINLNSGFFDLCVMKNGQLEMCNSFSCANEQELVYFTAMIYQNLRLNVHETPVFMNGLFETGYGYPCEVRKYIAHVIVPFEINGFSLNDQVKHIGAHRFENLITTL